MKLINDTNSAAAIGPYSHAIAAGKLLFTSGQIPVNPETSSLVEDEITAQTEQVIKNLESILKSQDLSLNNVIKTTVFLKDMKEFADFNSVYEEKFGIHKPARSTIEVSSLPLDSRVEIEAIAEISPL
jgi:2-iminobutanoate/2-iminopropanoate deaminase